ncbi:MAG: ABC transporter ATP-binding protein/permease [Oscillospiraceae bacterium]|nr:ABC transporter ATP-binding protein/permease [Oscillospiraceae bacterium]
MGCRRMSDKKRNNQWAIVKRVMSDLRHYQKWIVLTILLSGVTVVLTLLVPILIGKAIDFIEGAGNVNFHGITKLLMIIGGSVLITSLAQWIMNITNNRIAYEVIEDIRNRAMVHIQKLPLSYLDKQTTGDIVSRMISDADQFADGLLLGFTQLFTGVLTIAGTLLFMFRIHVGITIVVIIMTPLSMFAAGFIAKKTYALFRRQAQIRAAQTAMINETISHQKVVQAFGHEQQVMTEFDELNAELSDAACKATFYSSLTNPCTRFINALVYAVVGMYGAMSAMSGTISVGQLSCFLSYANQYTKPFNEISGVITELQNALACAERIYSLIDTEQEIPEQPEAVVMKKADGALAFDDISFSYSPERPLISHCSIDVKPGQRVAIVGPTGCGKTTLINLIMRFYDVQSGAVRVDGTDIRNVTRESLRSNIGMILQETWLKSCSVKENIRMGKPDATDEEVIAAAKSAHAHSFIKRLPQGYDTVISEKSGAVSQGQRQLLCIARLMLALPPMLILDEATSSIDTRTEMKIQSAFLQMMKGRTSFIVAHRLSTIREADLILVMKEGQIVEQGSHKALLEQDGFYASLYHNQFS